MSEEEKLEAEPEIKEEAPQEEDFKTKYYETLAEMENMRKRMQKERFEMSKFSIESAISGFLSPLDSFENALGFAKDADPAVKNWAIGFEMILTQFKDVLQEQGIKPFDSVGKFFDPLLHEAVETEETEEKPDGMIIQEFTKGYKSPNRTIRPARVKVAKAPKQEEAKEEQKEGNEDL